jgi:fumarate reductase subunit C
MSGRRPYVRPTDRFWWAHAPYLAYTLREVTGVAIAGYGLVLLAGIICLARGEAAYKGWLDFLASPWSLALHVVFLAAMVLHVLTWFQIMPKTMPRLVIHDQAVPQRLLTALGLGLAAAAFVVTFCAAKWIVS